ncbi:MAG: hypothetical protein ACO1RX_18830 [Candidatus Sericytochromatia bacterium]
MVLFIKNQKIFFSQGNTFGQLGGAVYAQAPFVRVFFELYSHFGQLLNGLAPLQAQGSIISENRELKTKKK